VYSYSVSPSASLIAICCSAFSPLDRPYQTYPPASYLKPNIQNVQFYDSVTNNFTDVTSNWLSNDCQTDVESISSSVSYPATCQFDSSNYSPTSSLVICRNAIKSIEYIFTHSQSSSSSIQQVDVLLTVQDLLYNTNTTSDSGSSLPSISQSFSVQWVDIPPSSSISNSSGNVIKR
jgi:hypothetical protein